MKGVITMKKLILSVLCLFCFTLSTATEKLVIVRGNGNYPPFEIYEKEQLSGIHIDMIKTVSKTLGIEVEFLSIPWARALKMAESGEVDAITFLGKNTEREKFAIFEEGNMLSYADQTLFLLKKNSNKVKFTGDFKSLIDFQPILIGKGFYNGEEFKKTDYLKKYEVNGLEEMVNMLIDERGVVGLFNDHETKTYLKKNGLLDKFYFITPYIYRNPCYLGFSRKKEHQTLAKKFSDEMTKYKNSKAYNELLLKYGWIGE